MLDIKEEQCSIAVINQTGHDYCNCKQSQKLRHLMALKPNLILQRIYRGHAYKKELT